MDTSFTPADASWRILIDSTERGIGAQVWNGNTTLDIQSTSGAPPSVDVTLELLVQDPALHSDRLIPVLPFGPETIPEL